MSVRAISRVPLLISRDPEVYNWILISVVLRELELVIIGEETQDLTIELPLRVVWASLNWNNIFWNGRLTLVVLRGFERVIIGEETQGLTTELPLRVV